MMLVDQTRTVLDILALREQGISYAQIGSRYGVHEATIYRWLRAVGQTQKKVALHPRDVVEQTKELLLQHGRVDLASATTGICERTIRTWMKRFGWKKPAITPRHAVAAAHRRLQRKAELTQKKADRKSYLISRQRIVDDSIPEPNSGCWLWNGSLFGSGYGRIGVGKSVILAHRVSYEAFHGPIPGGLLVRHSCDNPSCVNPDHLSCGTTKDNSQDMVRRGRAPSGRMNRTVKLSDLHVRLIRDDARGHKIIGLDYGISPSMVGFVKRRRCYSYVE